MLLLSASLSQLHTHPLHHTSIRLRIHLRYDAFTSLSITCANDNSGSMTPLTPLPLNTSRRHIKVSSSKLCTVRSRSTEIPIWGLVCRSRLMPATARDSTRMKRLASMVPEFRPGAFGRNLGCSWSVYLVACTSYSVSWSHVMARDSNSRESESLGDV